MTKCVFIDSLCKGQDMTQCQIFRKVFCWNSGFVFLPLVWLPKNFFPSYILTAGEITGVFMYFPMSLKQITSSRIETRASNSIFTPSTLTLSTLEPHTINEFFCLNTSQARYIYIYIYILYNIYIRFRIICNVLMSRNIRHYIP